MQNLDEAVKSIKEKEDFIRFIELLLKDYKNNPETWENKTIESYLEAMQSWIEDMDGYYINNNLPIPENVNWKTFSEILIAAKMYE